MQTNVFPKDYETQLTVRTNEQINAARIRCSNRINSINSQRTSKPEEKGSTFGIMIGFFGGFIACSCVCLGNDEAVGAGFITWVIVFTISTVIGFGIDKEEQSSYENNQSDIDSRISQENNELEKEIKDIKEKAEKEQQEYLVRFETNAQTMSVRFAESELAKEVIEWMTNGFCRTIDSADRRSHIEQINVPFIFNVFNNKITCNLGTYDFQLKRCQNLNNPLEQTALARAIVSAIQVNIIMRYPKDSSNTRISVNINYEYTSECPITTITYTAPNGNYEAVRNW